MTHLMDNILFCRRQFYAQEQDATWNFQFSFGFQVIYKISTQRYLKYSRSYQMESDWLKRCEFDRIMNANFSLKFSESIRPTNC